MKKELFLIRHAEAQSSDRISQDFERALTHTGMREAAQLGLYLSEKLRIQAVYHSAALRATDTAKILTGKLAYPIELIEDELLYEASPRNLLGFVNELPEKFESVAVVAHNPGISFFAEFLTKEALHSLQPCSMVRIQFENLEWSMITQASGRLIEIREPGTATI